MENNSEYRLVVKTIQSNEILYFYYDTYAESIVAETMIAKGLRGTLFSANHQQWIGNDHIRFDGESAYMDISS